jgi:hypothetical protein
MGFACYVWRNLLYIGGNKDCAITENKSNKINLVKKLDIEFSFKACKTVFSCKENNHYP